jgi:two-component system, cell cycle response regulator
VSDDHTKPTTIEEDIGGESVDFNAGEICLIQMNGPNPGRRYVISADCTLIGRSASCDIEVAQEASTVSNRHAEVLRRDETTLLVRDLGSTNGTFVNGKAVQEQELTNNDLVHVGDLIFKVLLGSDVETAYHEEMYRLLTRDTLTQLYNKRYLQECLDRELRRALRHNTSLSIAVFDIDDFKGINDQYGHVHADQVLQQLSDRLFQVLRHSDIPARYGGDEFVMLLPELDVTSAAFVGERLRRLISKTPFLVDGVEISATISIGVADYRECDVSLTPGDDPVDSYALALFHMADQRLLQAKGEGKDRVVGG